jgi:Tol biopolymer transport system component
MKYLLSITLLFIGLILFNSCGDDAITGSNSGNTSADFEIYVTKFNGTLLRVETYVVKSDGTNLRLFNDSLGVTSHSFNNKLTFAGIDTTGYYLNPLYTANSDGTNIVKISFGSYFPVYYILSPAGDKVLFTTDAGNFLVIANVDGTGMIQISDGIRGTEQVPKFSPDGKLIAFFEAPQSLETGLYIINTDGTGKKMLMDSIYYSANYTLDWSPDGTKILFQYNKNNLNNPKICSIDTSGMNLIDLAEGINPAYSPDGNKICFKKNVNQGIHDLIVMNSDGSNILNITNSLNQHEDGGYWNVNSDKILYSELSGGTQSLRIYDINSQSSTLLINQSFWGYWKY